MGQSYRRGSICPPWPQHSPDVTHAGGQGGSPSPGDCSSCCSQSKDPPPPASAVASRDDGGDSSSLTLAPHTHH